MKEYKTIHFIGIGGISMSALAQIMLDRGAKISGSDITKSNITDLLERKGAEIFIGHKENNLKDVDLVVYTSAIGEDNPEYMKASANNIPLMERAVFLGKLMDDYYKSTAIAGTHGKTTTTGMLANIMMNTEIDPTILLGGEYQAMEGNIRLGKKNYFLTEACEYKKNFLNFNPYIGVILNIEEDHLDYFKDIDEIKEAFREFAGKVPSYGFLVSNADDENQKNLYDGLDCNIKTFGIKNNAYAKAVDVKFNPYPSYDLYIEKEKICHVKLKVPGLHNIYNSLAAATCAYISGVANCSIKNGLENFNGTKRRFEYKGNYKSRIIIDDYAHHPTEIKATLDTVSTLTEGNVLVVFQPHTYSRTEKLLDKFAKSFSSAKKVVLIDIYAAREKNDGRVSSKDLVAELKKNQVDAVYMESFEKAAEYLMKNSESKDIIMTMGAGDVYKVGDIITNS
jgi:UDP-N-acetylmuramate--alanine ligase